MNRPIIRHGEGPLARWAPAVAASLLGLLVLAAPLPFGSVEPDVEAGLRMVVALALALAAASARGHRLRPVAVPAAALGGLALFAVLQATPLPPWAVRLLSPRHFETWGRAAEILDAHRASGLEVAEVGWPRLTLDPAATLQVAITCLAMAVLLVAAALAGRHRRPRRVLAIAVAAAGLFQVVYGLRQLLAGSLEVWGVRVLGVSDRLRGTYVNPNHAAYLLELALAVAFAAGWWAVVHARRERSLETRLILLLPPLLVWLGLLAGLALTRSRAGLLAALAAVVVQGILVALPGSPGRQRRRGWNAPALGAAVGAAVVGVAIVAGLVSGEAFSRLLGTSLSEVAWGERTRVAGLTFDLWLQFPLVGSGLGTFRDAFAAVEPAGFGGGTWLHAHNDYLELLATAGLVGAILVALAVGALGRRLLQVLVSGRRSEDRAAALAALGALAAVSVHEAFDFGLTVPANLYVLVVVCGAAAAARTVDRPPPEPDAGSGRTGQATASGAL